MLRGRGSFTNDLIIMLGGDHEDTYHISHYALVTCQDDVISLGDTRGYYLARNRESQSCRDSHPDHILDGFTSSGGDHWLHKLQQLYPTCESLSETFPLFIVDRLDLTMSDGVWWERWWIGLIKFFVGKK